MKKRLWYTRMGVGMIIASMLLSGCQKNPDSSIVVNKDMDNLIEEAQKVGESAMDIANIADTYETYQSALSDESLGVTVNVDAKVDIPEVNQMSIFRVQQQKIGQEFLNKVIEELSEGQTLYDAGVTLSMKTRKDIEEEISSLKAEIENCKGDYGDEAEMPEYIYELQQDLDALQAEYENAPAEIVWDGNESDGLLHSAAQMTQKEGGEDFYQWEYSLNPNGEVYYGANNGENDDYMSVFVQNNEERGNCLRYRRGKHGYDFTAIAVVYSTELNSIVSDVWPANEDRTQEYIDYKYGGAGELVKFDDEPTTISEEEARTTADVFMENMGLDDTYKYYEGGLYSEVRDIRTGADVRFGYRDVYILRYMRYVDGAFVTFDATSKHEEGWNGDDYVKKDWPVECVEIRVNDSGIVGFDYNAPLEVTETVVEKSNLKSFDEIKDTFEKMVMITNAKTDSELDSGVTVQVNRVVLGYARISEADSYDTGLLVPVWDFEGKVTDEYGTEYAGSVMTINAIDGSIIDRSLGY